MNFVTVVFTNEDKPELVLKKLYNWAGESDDMDESDEDQPFSKDAYSNVPRHKKKTHRQIKKPSTKKWDDDVQLKRKVEEGQVDSYFNRVINVNFSPWPVLNLCEYCEENSVSPYALFTLFPNRSIYYNNVILSKP